MAAARTSMVRAIQAVRQFSTSSSRQQLVKAPIKVFGVEGRYAHALFSAASKSNALEVVESELNEVQNALNTDADLAAYCFDPSIKKADKQAVLEKAMKESNMSEVTTNFISALAENSRLKKAHGIIGAYNQIMRAYRGEVSCTITTAKPLGAADMDNLEASLRKFVQADQTLKIDTEIDPSLIGGMVVNIGEYYLDMSMKTKIAKISRALQELA